MNMPSKELADAISDAYVRGFNEGIEEGIAKYAWLKDGVLYVGSWGTTFADAIARAQEEAKK